MIFDVKVTKLSSKKKKNATHHLKHSVPLLGVAVYLLETPREIITMNNPSSSSSSSSSTTSSCHQDYHFVTMHVNDDDNDDDDDDDDGDVPNS